MDKKRTKVSGVPRKSNTHSPFNIFHCRSTPFGQTNISCCSMLSPTVYKHFREKSWNTFQIVWIYDDLWINTFYIHRSKLFWCEHFRGTGDPDHLDPSPYVPWSKHGIWFMVIQVIQPKTWESWIHVFNSYENGWLNPITEGLGISSNFCKTKVVYTIRFPWISLFHP